MSLEERTVPFFEKQLQEIAAKSVEAQERRYFPTAHEIATGCAAYGGEVHEDIAKWRGILRERGGRNEGCLRFAELLETVSLTRSDFDLEGFHARAAELTDIGLVDDVLRAALFETLVVDRPSAGATEFLKATCTIGLQRAWHEGLQGLGYWTRNRIDAHTQSNRLRHGVETSAASSREQLLLAEAMRRSGPSDKRTDAEYQRFFEDLRGDATIRDVTVAEAGEEGDAAPAGSAPDRLVVLRRPTGKLTSDAKRLWDTFGDVADVELPLAKVPDRTVLDEIVVRWPHARGILATILGELVSGTVLRIRPTLLVGSPGSGKTTLLTTLAEALGVPSVVYPCSNSSDNTFGGTPARWSSAGPSVPLEQIRRGQVANPCVILDEIEKSPRNERHGSVLDVLLPMLEPHTSANFYEAGLASMANLSGVSYLATANGLDVPAPLRDRFRILRMPDPELEHVPDLCRIVVGDLAVERGQAGFLAPLAPDELELVAKAWGGGSLRRLRRVVETVLAVRERMETRQ